MVRERSETATYANATSDLTRAAAASGGARTRLYRKARIALTKLLMAAQAADGKGTLGVSITTLQSAVASLLALVPSTTGRARAGTRSSLLALVPS